MATVHLRIARADPDARRRWWQEYDVPAEPTDRILDLLNHVKWYQDGTLTYRRSCAHGVCGSDAMRVNGRNRLACRELVRHYGATIVIEPLLAFRVIKDLVVDLEPFFAQYRSVMPYLVNDDPPPATERRQSPEERARFDDTTKCILCAACTSACPSYWVNPDYLGPAAIVNGHRFLFDSRDQASATRRAALGEKNGVWRCRTIFNCTEACPRGIQVEHAIGEVKQAVLLDES
ncbi:MAG TPA: succinate dehydrogenase iron-sulfur subunit [Thermomicrobiaceae bacterium]|nr:succinate dehydrogenase iron-sulfur subunit [Thermomicrobiaceae bacterium]